MIALEHGCVLFCAIFHFLQGYLLIDFDDFPIKHMVLSCFIHETQCHSPVKNVKASWFSHSPPTVLHLLPLQRAASPRCSQAPGRDRPTRGTAADWGTTARAPVEVPAPAVALTAKACFFTPKFNAECARFFSHVYVNK